MINVTRLNGPAFALNPDLIERIEATPDTVIHLVGGTNYVVVESVEEIVARVRVNATLDLQFDSGTGADGAVNILYRDRSPEERAELTADYKERFANPYSAAERGYVDDVIDPRETRRVLVRSLSMLRTKREQLPSRKHGNVPL